MTAAHSARNTTTIVRDVPIGRITASSFNPRKHFDETGLDELAASISQHGVIEPIVVRQVHTNLPATEGIAWYEIIAGERRWRASKLAGMETIPTRILGQVDDETALQLALIENLQRQDLDPIEEAQGYHLLNHIVGMKQKQIAEAVNRSQPAVANAMRLLELPSDVQQRIRAGELSRSHGVAIAKYSGFPKVQSAIADYVVQHKMTSHQTEKFDLYNYQFLQTGVVKQVSTWHTPFDVEQCKSCPFGAYRAGRHEGGLCLNPEHWDELAAAAEKERSEKVTGLIEASSDNQVLDLSELQYGDYESLAYSVPPPGCTEDCACRRIAQRGQNGEPHPVCIDPKRIKGLRRDYDKAKKKRRAELREKHLMHLEEAVDDKVGFGSSELAVLAAAAFRTVSKPTSLKLAGERHGVEGPASEKVSYGQKDILEHLARLDPLTLVKFALEAVLRDDIMDIYGEYSVKSARVEFYVGLFDPDQESEVTI